MSSKPDFGTLYDYETGSEIGPATEDQMRRSLYAARLDGGLGVIQGAIRKGWRIYNNGVSVIEYGDTPPTGPAHGGSNPCDCYDCNGTEVDGPYLFEHLCYVGDIPPEQSQRSREEELRAKLREPFVQLDERGDPVPARCGNCGRITSMHDDAACEEVTRIQGLAP